jgi:HK97 family phage portal protein
MVKEFAQFIRKTAAQMFTWPSRYRTERLGPVGTVAGQTVTPESALTCSTVAACVRLLSETMASLPLHVYRDLGNSKVIAEEHPVYDVLHTSPNDFQTSYTWMQEAMTHCLLHGNFFAFIERDASGNPAKLWPLHPQGILLEAVNGTVRYQYYYGGERSVFNYTDILHLKGLSLDGLMGLSVIHMAREGIGLALAQDRHASAMFRNNARLGTVITMPGFLKGEQRENIRESFESKFAGVLNSGKAFVLEGGMTVEQVGMSSEDAQFLQSRQFSVVEIARWFRVPPTMVGDMTRVSYSSSESEMQLFAMHSLVPWCANFEAEFNKKLFPDRTQFFAKFDVNSIVRGDLQSRYSAYSQGLTAGFLTVADVRLAENLPFIDGTDKLNRPANMMPHTGETNADVQPVA